MVKIESLFWYDIEKKKKSEMEANNKVIKERSNNIFLQLPHRQCISLPTTLPDELTPLSVLPLTSKFLHLQSPNLPN